MPIKRAAYKALRSDKKKRARNVSTISEIKTLAKKLNELIPTKDKAKIEQSKQAFISAMDKAAQKGIVHRRTASRKIARVSSRISAILK